MREARNKGISEKSGIQAFPKFFRRPAFADEKNRFECRHFLLKSSIFSVLIFLDLVLLPTLPLSLAADIPPNDSLPETQLTSTPVTNESVEVELRKVREVLRASPEFRTNDAPTHLRLAKTLSQQGDPNGAIEEYQAALTLNPSLSEAYRELGAVYIDKHEWGKAEQALRKEVELNPHDYQALYWLGRSLIAQNHFHQARETLVKATQLDPENPETHSDLALTLMALGQIEEAEKTLQDAIALQPDFAEAHHRLEQVRVADDSSQLIQSARHILQTLFRRK